MADDEVATKAPESDAQEAPQKQPETSTIIPGDTKAQEGPSMGEHCVTDRPTPAGEAPTGELTKLGDVDVYIAKPSDYPHAPSKLLLLLTGGTGMQSTNNQLQADKYAAEGYIVVMPDQFGGNPAPTIAIDEPDPKDLSWLESGKLKLAEAAKSFRIDMWLAYHTPEKVLPLLHKVIDAAKEEFADAIANGGGIYGVGYCFGARYTLILSGEHPDTALWGQAPPKDEEQGVVKKEPLLKVGAIAHPTMVTKEELEAVKMPTYIAAVKDDAMFSEEEVLNPARRTLEKNHVEHEVKVFSGVPHGFAVYGDYADAKIKQEQTQAFGEMLGWIQSH